MRFDVDEGSADEYYRRFEIVTFEAVAIVVMEKFPKPFDYVGKPKAYSQLRYHPSI